MCGGKEGGSKVSDSVAFQLEFSQFGQHSLQFDVELLHFDHLVVAGMIVERIAALREIVQDVGRIEVRNPGEIMPR